MTSSSKGAGSSAAQSKQNDEGMRARAEKLHRQSIVIDTHNDITSPLMENGFDLGMRGDDPNAKVKTHTDLVRMKAGGLGAEFFAVYVDKEFVNKKPAEGGGAADGGCAALAGRSHAGQRGAAAADGCHARPVRPVRHHRPAL
jgi:hypothetical protein